MTRLIITHGRSQEFGIPESLEREWVEALRWGLERAYAPFARDIPVSLAFYGDYWRVDAGEVTRSLDADTPSDFQRGILDDILAAIPEERGGTATVAPRGGWDTLSSLVGKLDGLPGVGEAALTVFLKDIDRYFDDGTLRGQAIQRVIDAVGEADDEVILLAHSLGSVVAYDTLRRHPDLPVRGLVTFGSPLGLDTVRVRLEATGGALAFPPGISRWANIYEPRDIVAANRDLAGRFPSSDGRAVADTRLKGRRPGVLKLVAAHDALVYLSSAALGTATRTMVEELGGERSAMAMPESAPPVGSDPGWAESAPGDEAFASAADDDAGALPDDGAVASVDGDVGYSTDAYAGAEEDAGAIPPEADAGSPGAGAEGAEEDAAASLPDGSDRSVADSEPASPPSSPRRVAPPLATPDGGGQRSRSVGARRGIPIDRDLGPVGSHPDTPSGPARGSAVSPSGEALREVETSAAASFAPVVAPGSVHKLAFEVGRAASGNVVTPLSTWVPAAAETLDLTVLVQAPNFEVVDPDTNEPVDGTATISLALDNPDALITGGFHLRAESPDERVAAMIRLRFLHDNTPIGTIRITTLIDAQPPLDRPEVESFGGHIHYNRGAPQGAELLLLVNRDNDGTYQITATLHGGLGRSIPRAKLGSFPVTGEAWEYAKALLEKFKDTDSLPEADREDRINNLGLDLWRKLPDAFKAFYWEHVHDGVETILVCSEEPYIPWELIKPERSVGGETAPMLGQAFAMARWDDERQIPNPIEVDDFVVIAPTYATNPLPSARQEATELVNRFGANWVDPGNRTQVVALLKSPSLQVLHFSGHGEFNTTPDDSRIALADIPLDIIDVNGATFAQNVAPPLVFLNACEVGTQGWSLTQIGGWAEAFCGAGCAAFIGPYWAVSDRVAFKAAMRFYSGLQHGMTVGEAMQEIRDQFYDDAEDRFHPSWLAYSLHCHPNVTVRI